MLRERFKVIIYKIKIGSLFFAFLLSSCAVAAKDIRPNQSAFAQVKSTVELELYSCNKENKECKLESLGKKAALGSGSFFIYKNKVAFMSAAHVCLGPVYEIWDQVPNKSRIKTEIFLKSYTGKIFRGKIKYANIKYDFCVIEIAEDLKIKKIPRVSVMRPVINKKFYTLAAPFSIFHPGVVPLLEGRYFGSHKIFSFYSIASGPGASGAAVFNEENKIVGVVQRTHSHFPEISLSIKHKDMIDCLDSYLDAKKREIEVLIE